jgi:glycosyltransferase involved in cell wall biosynthesis
LSLDERAAVVKRFALHDKFVLYSGGADDRKNLPQLIKAFANIKAELDDSQPVFAGKMPEYHINSYKTLARTQGLGNLELIFTGYLTDEKLVALYGMCRLYVLPS